MKAPIICKGDSVICTKGGSLNYDQVGVVLSDRLDGHGVFVGYLVRWDSGTLGTYQRSNLRQVSSPATTAAFLAWWFSHPRCVILGDGLLREREFTFTITTTPSEVQALIDAAAFDHEEDCALRWHTAAKLRHQLVKGVQP